MLESAAYDGPVVVGERMLRTSPLSQFPGQIGEDTLDYEDATCDGRLISWIL